MASSIHDVFAGCPYNDDYDDDDDDDDDQHDVTTTPRSGRGYDLKIGTSERGDTSVEERTFTLPKYEHSLVVFGGVAGIEECVDADESIKLPGNQSNKLFDVWLNTCPYQGSRTIRTEEAVMISLATLRPLLIQSARDKEKTIQPKEPLPDVEFSDAPPSEESSSSEDSASESDGGTDNDDNSNNNHDEE
jgi:acetolactate synthase regulatory subunit